MGELEQREGYRRLGKVSAVSEEPLGLVDGRVFRIRPARQDDLDRLL